MFYTNVDRTFKSFHSDLERDVIQSHMQKSHLKLLLALCYDSEYHCVHIRAVTAMDTIIVVIPDIDARLLSNKNEDIQCDLIAK